ncbi:Epsin-2 [Tritrichomonas musculus]|uniref:Epsin-2 n=1 Tax=Tritrichomonas musculus TaxID=1915356 RepID=A0ABR2KYR0_9EUKA
MWKKTKEIARSAEYMFKNKDEVQKRVLEATRDDEDQITESEFMTVAHLTDDLAALSSIRKTLWKRFSRVTKHPTSCRKALQILDYCVRYGSEKCLNMCLEGTTELQMVSNSHHFSSDKPKEYMNEDQCRNLAQNLLTFVKNRNSYEQARKSGQSTIQRVKSFYVEPLQVKIKPDNSSGYGGPSAYYGNSNQAMNEVSQQRAQYSLNPSQPKPQPQQQQRQSSNTTPTNANNGIQWSSDSDSEPENSPLTSQNRPQQQQQGGGVQSRQTGFSMFNQQNSTSNQTQNSNPFQPQQQQNSNPFQPQQQNQNPFQSQQQNQNPFQNQPNPFNSQQQQYSPYSQQPQQQQNLFTQPANNTQQPSFFPPSSQSLEQQQKEFFTQSSISSNYQQPQQTQQPLSADEILFGPTPSQQQQNSQYVPPPRPDPAYDGIVDFSSTPMQPYSNQPMNQQNGKNNGMLDEFGDLVNLDLNRQPTRAHGRPEMQRGYNGNNNFNYNQPNQYQQKPF